MNYVIPTIGVEEEYQLVDPLSGQLLPNCKDVMRTLRLGNGPEEMSAEIQHELHLNQIEMASGICGSLDEVNETVGKTRRLLARAARTNGCRLASAGTNAMPLPEDDALTPKSRYRAMTERYQQIARDLLIFGCHVHVAIENREHGMGVMNRCRRWLPILQAITANSPYWDGEDTGYASYRRELWAQWPMAGPPPNFESFEDYETCIAALIQCGAIRDESFIYWDIRLPTKVPTIEFRAADAMTSIEETVGYAGLVRAMVMQASLEENARGSVPQLRPNVLSYAIWHSARYGLSNSLVDVSRNRRLPARELLRETMLELNGILERTPDRQYVDNFVERLLDEGTGADRQRQAKEPTQVIAEVVRGTEADLAGQP